MVRQQPEPATAENAENPDSAESQTSKPQQRAASEESTALRRNYETAPGSYGTVTERARRAEAAKGKDAGS